jgi:hypothetical protein
VSAGFSKGGAKKKLLKDGDVGVSIRGAVHTSYDARHGRQTSLRLSPPANAGQKDRMFGGTTGLASTVLLRTHLPFARTTFLDTYFGENLLSFLGERGWHRLLNAH